VVFVIFVAFVPEREAVAVDWEIGVMVTMVSTHG